MKFYSLPRAVVVAILVVCGALIAASFVYDAPVRAAILEYQGKEWRESPDHKRMGAISKNGDWPQLMLMGGIALIVAWRMRSKRWTQLIVAALISSTLAGMLANVSRLTTGRTRPRESPKIEQGFYGPWHDGKLTVGNSKFNAFPSGHTATAVGFAAPFVFGAPVVGVPVMVGALLVAWSRMALGAHNLSDVVTSILLALLVGWFTLRWVRLHGQSTWEKSIALVKQRFRK